MSSTRKKIVAEWSKDENDENANGGVTSDDAITLEKPHQRRDQHPSAQFKAYDFGKRGFWCESCGAKCTLGNDAEEYGHFKNCDHRNVDREPNNLRGKK